MHILRPIKPEGEPMYVIRCDFVNGLHREYGFDDLGLADAAFKTILAARNQKRLTEPVFDQGGRSAVIDGTNIQCLELVQIEIEASAAIKLVREIQNVQRLAGVPMQPQQAPAEPDPEYAVQGAIGRTSNFAS
jgi:hypothetical protein